MPFSDRTQTQDETPTASRRAGLIRMSDDAWGSVLDTNLGGAFLCTRRALAPSEFLKSNE